MMNNLFNESSVEMKGKFNGGNMEIDCKSRVLKKNDEVFLTADVKLNRDKSKLTGICNVANEKKILAKNRVEWTSSLSSLGIKFDVKEICDKVSNYDSINIKNMNKYSYKKHIYDKHINQTF